MCCASVAPQAWDGASASEGWLGWRPVPLSSPSQYLSALCVCVRACVRVRACVSVGLRGLGLAGLAVYQPCLPGEPASR